MRALYFTLLVQFTSAATVIYRNTYWLNSPTCSGQPEKTDALPADVCLTYPKHLGGGQVSTTQNVYIKYSAIQEGETLEFTTTYYSDDTCTTLDNSNIDNSNNYGLNLNLGTVNSTAATVTDSVTTACYNAGADWGYTQYSLGDELTYPSVTGYLVKYYTGSGCATQYGYSFAAFDVCGSFYDFNGDDDFSHYSHKSLYNGTTVVESVYDGTGCQGNALEGKGVTSPSSDFTNANCSLIEYYWQTYVLYIPTPSTASPSGPSGAPSYAPTISPTALPTTAMPTASPTPIKLLLSDKVGAIISFAGIAAHVGMFLLQRFSASTSSTSSNKEEVAGVDL